MPTVGVWHYHEWDWGFQGWDYDYGKFDFSYDNGTMGSRYRGPLREFYADTRDMLNFLLDYLDTCSINELIITPYYWGEQFRSRYYLYYFKRGERQSPDYNIFQEMRKLLLDNGVRGNSHAGVKIPIEGNRDIIEMFLEGAFSAVSKLCFIADEKGVVIAPNHHMNLVFYSNNYDTQKKLLKSLLTKHPNLRYFDAQTNLEEFGPY